MNIRLSAAHRDALYEHILNRLSGIADLWKAVDEQEFEQAARLGWEYSDYLRLILDDLGWGYGPGRTISLSAPPDVLQRVFTRLRELTIGLQESEADDWAEMRERVDRNRMVVEACDKVLGELDFEE